MKKIEKKSSIRKYFNKIFVIIGVISITLLIAIIAIGIPYTITGDKNLLIALLVLIPVLVLSLLITAFLFTKNNYQLFYRNFYKVTEDNIDLLTSDKRNLKKYNVDNIQEFNELNEKLDRLSIHNNAIEILSRNYDYSKIPLEYINKKDHLLNEQSFKKYIREIIYCSEYLRNATISISYDNNIKLDNKDINEIVESINFLLDMKGTLIVLKEDQKGFYIYVPAIESLTSLKATLDTLLQKITVSIKTLNGIELFSPKISAVIYPFTVIADIFSDLHYADRQDDRINIYLPDRYINTKNDSIFKQSNNVKHVYKIIGSLANIKIENGDFDKFLDEIIAPVRQVALYYDFEQTGIILYDKERKKTGGSLAIKFDENENILFMKEKAVSDDFVNAVVSSVDPDKSIFFSKRKLVTPELGKQLDIYGITSGYFFEVTDINGKYAGIIYFININKKECPLDSYMQASLTMFSTILTGLLRNVIIERDVIDMKEREQNLLKLTNIRSYAIDRRTYEITSFSPSLKRDIPELEVGQLCYKTMFGFDKPCSTCPLLTKSKAIKRIRGNDYEVASVLNSKASSTTELTLSGINVNSLTTNRFDKDYLINTYYSLVERLNDLYNVKARGYIALLKIKNVSELVEKLGNEGFSFLIRNFNKEVNDKVCKNNEQYVYKNDTIAIIFSGLGKLDVIDAIEKIYLISKKIFIKDKQNHELKISYNITKYPQEHSNANDFIRHLETLCARQDESEQDDMLYVEENDFSRPASKEQYILNIINQATISKNFIIKCQPMVTGSSKAIYGSELLIRLSDEYYNSLLNTEEVIAVSAKYGKLYNISDILIDYVGNLYKQYGISIFKPAGFNNMSINADYNYFKDEYSINKILDAMAKYHLPKQFLTFEVTEKEIAEHYDSFKQIVSSLNRNDINIVCDRYYGDNLSFDKLKALGITHIKTDRSLLANIDINNEQFSNLSRLMDSANLAKINMTLVGVENGEQYKLIKGTNIVCNLQGYYFHHPLSSNELIEAIRSDNVM